MTNNLNKPEFFDALMILYPDAMKQFCDWIDRYKEEVNWNDLFNGNIELPQFNSETLAPKFHDIPYEMQMGIILRYCAEVTNQEDQLLLVDELKESFTAIVSELQKAYTSKQ